MIPIPSECRASPPEKGEPEWARSCDVDPTFVAECSNVLVGCTHISGAQIVAAQGREQFATAFATYFVYILHRLFHTDPVSTAIASFHYHYIKNILPRNADFGGTSFHRLLVMIDAFGVKRWNPNQTWKDTDRSLDQDPLFLTRYLVGVAQVEYQRRYRKKVPRWILRFALDSLSLDPQPPAFVVVECLTIIAIDMGCDIPDTRTRSSAQVQHVSDLITTKLEEMATPKGQDTIFSKRKAIYAVFPFAIFLVRDGQRAMFDAISRVAVASNPLEFAWEPIRAYINSLFCKPSHPSLNPAIALMSPLNLGRTGGRAKTGWPCGYPQSRRSHIRRKSGNV